MNSKQFPYSDPFEFHGFSVSCDWVKKHIEPKLTPERVEKIENVVAARTYSITAVLENIYDRGNTSAVMRSAEAMGIQSVHHIEQGERFKVANRVSKGADKWLDQFRYSSTNDAIDYLRAKDYQIVTTSLIARDSIESVDFSIPSAIVLGNERDGVSEEMLERADHIVKIPMQGFVESFNISVAAALAFYHIRQDRVRRQGFHSDLGEKEKAILEAVYQCRSNSELTCALLDNLNALR